MFCWRGRSVQTLIPHWDGGCGGNIIAALVPAHLQSRDSQQDARPPLRGPPGRSVVYSGHSLRGPSQGAASPLSRSRVLQIRDKDWKETGLHVLTLSELLPESTGGFPCAFRGHLPAWAARTSLQMVARLVSPLPTCASCVLGVPRASQSPSSPRSPAGVPGFPGAGTRATSGSIWYPFPCWTRGPGRVIAVRIQDYQVFSVPTHGNHS